MDSSQQATSLQTTQEAANLAQIRASKFAFWQTILTIVFGVPTLVLMLWPYLSSRGGSLLAIGPLLIILLSASLALSAVSLIIFSLKRLKTKPLIAELQATAGKVDSLLDEKQQFGEELSRRNSDNKALQRQLGEAQAAIKQLEGSKRRLPPAPEGPKPKLDFQIDEKESHVNVHRGGPNVSRITADIKLRCEKETTDREMVVRAFRLSLHRTDADGKVIAIPYEKQAQVIWEDSKGKLVPLSDGWEIAKARSDFRFYSFAIEITPQVQDTLSPDYFFQLTMDAIGQDAVTKTVHVKDWTEGEYSPISLKPFAPYPLEAQKEIKRLKAELESYKQTNAALGKKNQEYDWLIQLAKDQKAAIHEYVALKEFTFCYMDQLTPSIFRVVFALSVTNNSVLDISLSDELDGTIRFEGVELLEKKRVISPLKDAPHGATRSLTIEQRLSKGEADTVRDAKLKTGQANFEFDDLIVNIMGGSRSPDITSRKLKIPKNTTASAFPITQAIRSARVKALSYVWGRCVQLQEPLRIDDNPIAKSTVDNWESGSLSILEREGYTKDEAKQIMQQVIPEGDFPETSAPSQRQWIHYGIAVLEDLIAKEIKAIHGTAEPRRLTHKEILRRIEELPVEDQARAYQAFGALLEKAADNKPNK